MPIEVTVGPPVLTINQGSTFMVTDRAGEIHPYAELGVFAQDTRFVSYYRCTIERQPWTLLTSTTPSYYCARLVYINPALPAPDNPLPHGQLSYPGVRGDLPAGSVGLILTRTVGDDVTEQFVLTNYGTAPARFHFELALRSDFLDLFDVKAHRYVVRGDIQTTWQANGSAWDLLTAYVNGDFQRRFIYRVRESGSPPHYANGRIVWVVELPPGGSWQAVGQMLLDSGLSGVGNAGGSVAQHATRRAAWQQQTTSLASSNVTVAAAFRQSIDDMAALRLHEEDMAEGQWVPAAGVPWFVALFGRDSLVVSYQTMVASADFARGALQKLAQYQAVARDDWRDAQPGKILHELRRGELAHFHLVPHTPYYGTWDATPLYLVVLHEAWK